jgi:FtsH-binding integral membrane protein
MSPAQAEAAQYDVGLRQYMLGIYNYMASGLALTGIVAVLLASSETAMSAIFGTPLMWVVMLAPLAVVLFLQFGIQRISATTAQGLFWLYAALMGASLSSIFVVYTGESIARTFFITAAAFAGLSLYGYTTKKSLSGFGSFLIMGVWGLIIAGLVNIFLQSSMLQFVISAAGVLIFSGLTAYDTQMLKESYYSGDDREAAAKKSVLGALELYLDFINLFIYLLRLIGDRR